MREWRQLARMEALLEQPGAGSAPGLLVDADSSAQARCAAVDWQAGCSNTDAKEATAAGGPGAANDGCQRRGSSRRAARGAWLHSRQARGLAGHPCREPGGRLPGKPGSSSPSLLALQRLPSPACQSAWHAHAASHEQVPLRGAPGRSMLTSRPFSRCVAGAGQRRQAAHVCGQRGGGCDHAGGSGARRARRHPGDRRACRGALPLRGAGCKGPAPGRPQQAGQAAGQTLQPVQEADSEWGRAQVRALAKYLGERAAGSLQLQFEHATVVRVAAVGPGDRRLAPTCCLARAQPLAGLQGPSSGSRILVLGALMHEQQLSRRQRATRDSEHCPLARSDWRAPAQLVRCAGCVWTCAA